MLIKTTDKWEDCRAAINMWLSDQTLYCNNCGENFNAQLWQEAPCCEEPQIGRNMDHMKGVLNENKRIKEQALNDFSSNKDQNLRMSVAMPPKLLDYLENHYKKYHGNDAIKNGKGNLFRDKDELHKFMKKFPMLCTAKKV